MKLIRNCCCVLLLGFSFIAKAQPATIAIEGIAESNLGMGGLYQVIVINQRTSMGMLAEWGGHFKLDALKTDTILVSASGYSVKKICFKDSVNRAIYYITVKLDSIHYTLAEVKIYPKKNLKEIDEERSRLGDVPNTDINKNPSPLFNPISYLYERFSRLERSKRKVAQLEDGQKRMDVLKDMLHLYIRNDIIALNDKQFEDFIDYMNLKDDFVKNSTDYDLITTIKYKYEQYEKIHEYTRGQSHYTREDNK